MDNTKEVLNRANEIMDNWKTKMKSGSRGEIIERGLINENVAYEITLLKGIGETNFWGIILIEEINGKLDYFKGIGTYFNFEHGVKQYVKDFKELYGNK